MKSETLVRAEGRTNPNWGKSPDERTVTELLQCGVVNIDKPSGPSSHQVTAWARDILKAEKAGHGGTLDPHATGVLPIAFNNATKGIIALTKAKKEYVGVVHFHQMIDVKKLEDKAKSFIGTVEQLPPVRSAVKRRRRKREIYSLGLLDFNGRDALIQVSCESGTYIRRLAVDLGKALGCGANLKELRRTGTGGFSEEKGNLYTLQDLKDAWVFWIEDRIETCLKKLLLPVESLFEHLPSIVIRDSAVGAICHGADPALPGVLQVSRDISPGEMIVIKTLKGEAVALAKSEMSSEAMVQKEYGRAARLLRVIMPIATYPSFWKSKE
jgi:H/ACA ribonucleoprotein complex subunit 4